MTPYGDPELRVVLSIAKARVRRMLWPTPEIRRDPLSLGYCLLLWLATTGVLFGAFRWLLGG